MSSQFQPYLESIRAAALKRQEFYVSTDAKGKPPLKLMAKRAVEKKQEQQKEEFAPVPVLEGIRTFYLEHKHVLLVGRPGSGKSTTLDQLLIEEATRSLEDSSLPIPVLVQLKYDRPILKLIHETLRRHRLRLSEAELDDLLFDGKLLLLLDGVNEIPRGDLQQELQKFREDNLNVPMIFTTRDLAIGGALGIEKQLEMQPLTEAQMQAFIREFDPEQAEQMLRQLKDRLRELGQTPLLLWMLCDVFQRKGTIPENLGLVFREFTQHYERNLKEGMRIESDRDWWQPVLQQLAWVMMQGEKPTEFRVAIRREEAVRAIRQFLDGKRPYAEDFARKCLRDLQKYHLIQAGTNNEELEFRHQLIQEYYAAEALLEQLPKLDDEQLKQEFLNFLKWTEPVALMLALVDEAQAIRVVEQALVVNWMLGSRLAGEVQPEFQQETLRFVEILELPDWLEIECLGETRSKKVIFRLLKFAKDSNSDVRARAAFALGKIGSAATPELLKLVAEDSDSYVRLRAAFALREIGGDTAISELLKLLEHSDSDVRARAAFALGKISSDVAIPGLLKLLEHSNYNVRTRAASALGEIGSDAAIPGLLKLLEHSDSDMRTRATLALNKIGSDAAILELLKLLEHSGSGVRARAAFALGEIGSDATIPELLKLLEHSDSGVRVCAAFVLSKIGSDTTISGSLRLLQRSDFVERPDFNVRGREIRALGEISSDVAIFELLKLVENSDSDVCRNAAEALGNVAEKQANAIAPHLPHLLTLISTDSGQYAYDVILAIQENCKYYDYKIYQDYLKAQKADRHPPQNNDRSPTTIYNFPNATEAKIFENVNRYHETNSDNQENER